VLSYGLKCFHACIFGFIFFNTVHYNMYILQLGYEFLFLFIFCYVKKKKKMVLLLLILIIFQSIFWLSSITVIKKPTGKKSLYKACILVKIYIGNDMNFSLTLENTIKCDFREDLFTLTEEKFHIKSYKTKLRDERYVIFNIFYIIPICYFSIPSLI
jgi:uncharacterized membrane protein (Fun14 family)